MSFTDQRLITSNALPTAFVGACNYTRLLADSSFWAALRNNFLFVVVVTPLQPALALGLARLVNQQLAGARIFRTTYFMLVATTVAVVAVIWSLLYSPDAGVIYRLAGLLSFGTMGLQDWLRDPMLVLPAVMLMSIWQGKGFQMLVFLAGLQVIAGDLYEAATFDGAKFFNQFRFITLPLLKNTTVFVLFTTTIYAFQLFTQLQSIANSGASAPIFSFRALVTLMVHEGFRNGKVGCACAVSVVFFLIVLPISTVQCVWLRSEENAA